jgi:hypothetical protein
MLARDGAHMPTAWYDYEELLDCYTGVAELVRRLEGYVITLPGLNDGALPAETIQRDFILGLIPKPPIMIKPLDAAFVC